MYKILRQYFKNGKIGSMSSCMKKFTWEKVNGQFEQSLINR